MKKALSKYFDKAFLFFESNIHFFFLKKNKIIFFLNIKIIYYKHSIFKDHLRDYFHLIINSLKNFVYD